MTYLAEYQVLRARELMTRALFSLTIFTGSFLLFMIQPMVGKILLPALGGVPAVWTTCMLFFQAALLAGYIYAERGIRLLGCARQSMLHLMLMIGAWLLLPVNVDLSGAETAYATPIIWLVSRLSASIGILFFLLAANAPLVQRYYSQTAQPDADDPYFLYSASNTGSLLALLLFPLMLEPFLGAAQIRWLWSIGYLLLTILLSFCAFITWNPEPLTKRGSEQSGRKNAEADDCKQITASSKKGDNQATVVMTEPGFKNVNWHQAITWAFLGFMPCGAMLAVTTHITTDISSAPLLWIVPLAGYLVSFILVFARSPFWRQIKWERFLFPSTLLGLLMYYYVLTERAWLAIGMHFLFMMLACMFFHSRLAQARPAVEQLNSFYVWMSAGGVAAGIFTSVIAPLVFVTQAEYLLIMLITALAAAFCSGSTPRTSLVIRQETLISGIFSLAFCLLIYYSRKGAEELISLETARQLAFSLFLIFMFYRRPISTGLVLLLTFAALQIAGKPSDARILHQERSFYGILKVSRLATDGQTRDPDLKIAGIADIFHRLHHGYTLHGVERRVKVRYQLPLSYYSREGPIGALFKAAIINRNCRNIGVVGLGCGTIAWYGRAWQNIDFFEIDPAVIRIARNPDYFTFLSNCRSSLRIIAGDARVQLRHVPDRHYDLLVLDAYSSGSVPTHLLTLEAFELYQRKLQQNGLIVFHISNRYLKLSPVIERICKKLGMNCLEAFYEPERDSIRYDWYDYDQMASSHWVAASMRPEKLEMLKNTGIWTQVPAYDNYNLWTDDYANLFQVYNWR